MNILLNTALMVASGPLVSAAVADQVLKSDRAQAGGFAGSSIIAKSVTRKVAAKPTSVRAARI
jgi:hypothetical protein